MRERSASEGRGCWKIIHGLVRNRRPGRVRVEYLHLAEFLQAFGPQILLVDDAVLTHDECLHSRDAIFGGCGHQREAADHYPFNYEIQSTERSLRPLSLENLEEKTVVGLR